MEKTYKNFMELSKLLTEEQKQKTLSDLALDYQHTLNKVVFGHIYCRLYYFFKTQVDKYFYLTEEDKESFLLEELHKALLAYDKSKGAEVQTLINVYLNRRLYAESSMLNHQKRKLNYNSDSYDEWVINNTEPVVDNVYESVEFVQALQQMELTTNEISCCKIIMEDTHELKNTEIAKMMGITSAGVAYIKGKLKKKLKPIMTV